MTNHQHFDIYIGTEVDPMELLWPIQHWFQCVVCKRTQGRRPVYE